MKPNQADQPEYYDANGQPVYSTPPSPRPTTVIGGGAPGTQIPGQSYDPQARIQYANEPGVVHVVRPVEPEKQEVGPELKRRHEESKKRYPHLNLSEGEVVILDLKRHPIGLLIPLSVGGVVLLIVLLALVFYPTNTEELRIPGYGLFTMIAGLLMVLIGIGTYVAVWVYLRNQFFMTNESVIQELQYSLFSKREQTVSLGSVEDASFRQSGILQTMLNYGTVRLSTEGEETTYVFHYVENPRAQVATLNNGVEAFKNGRPVELGPEGN